MPLWRQVRRGARALLSRRAVDREIADEVGHYLEEAAADRLSREASVSVEEARRAVRLEVGQAAALEEQLRGVGWESTVETLGADLRYAARLLRRKPAFTALAVLTLGLGIGASAAIFSAVSPVLFEPLPFPHADRLVTIWDGDNSTRTDVTFGTYRELLQRSRSMAAAAAFRPLQPTLLGSGEPERLEGQTVSASYFRVLGVSPALGRDFLPSDDVPGAPFVAVISDGLWRRRFAADPGVVGRQISLGSNPVTVIGVMPASFESVLSPAAEIWGTLQYDPTLPVNGREWGHHLRVVGRLRPGTTLAQANAELNAIAGSPIQEFPRPNWAALGSGLITAGLQDDLTRSVRPALLAIVGAVVLLLTLACVNVTNLLLASGFERRAEIAVRAALGAPRGRLVGQLLVESGLLTLLGGLVGVALAYGTIDVVVAMSPSDLPRADAIGVDGPTLAFALGLTTLIGMGIGIVPALQQSHGLRSVGLRSTSRVTRQEGTRRVLVVVQIAVAVVLLVGAGLLARSLQRLFSLPPGFEPQQLLTMQVQTSGQRYRNPDATHQFFADALEAARQVPGVTAAAFSTQLPLTGEEDVWGVHFESVPTAAAAESRDGYRYAVSPGYFEAMGIPLRRGRLLNAGDAQSGPRVAVINEAFAHRRLPGLDPIGQRLRIGPNEGPWFTIVGVVADVKQTSLALNRADAVYVTNAQWARFADGARWLVVRANGDAAALTSDIRRAIWSIDKNQPIQRVATMAARLDASVAEQRFALLLFEVFGLVALTLAAVGTYSLLSGNVADRTREIGVRAVLGATRRSVVSLVIRQGLTLAALGIVLGLAAASISSRALVTLLFGISTLDAVTYLAVVGVLLAVSAIACGIPALRAARVQPSVALRFE